MTITAHIRLFFAAPLLLTVVGCSAGDDDKSAPIQPSSAPPASCLLSIDDGPVREFYSKNAASIVAQTGSDAFSRISWEVDFSSQSGDIVVTLMVLVPPAPGAFSMGSGGTTNNMHAAAAVALSDGTQVLALDSTFPTDLKALIGNTASSTVGMLAEDIAATLERIQSNGFVTTSVVLTNVRIPVHDSAVKIAGECSFHFDFACYVVAGADACPSRSPRVGPAWIRVDAEQPTGAFCALVQPDDFDCPGG